MIPTNSYEYLKEHIGRMFSIAEFEKHKLKWTQTKLTEQDCKNPQINCCQELLTEITLESDYKGNEIGKNKENQEYAEALLQKYGVGYYISSHQGKSDYIRFRFKTQQKITPELRLAIIRHLAKPGLIFDELFRSLEFVRPVPGKPHWKHTYQIEKVIKVVEGQDFDIDAVGIKPIEKSKKVVLQKSGGNSQPKGWGRVLSIDRLFERYQIEGCPNCEAEDNYVIKNNEKGCFFCIKCNHGGGVRTLIRHHLRSVKQ